jgi:DNA polymerase-3 subunit delta'
MPFDAILGQQQAIHQLRTALRSGHLAHAYLFTGIEGIGKCTAAVVFAKALNCLTHADDSCDNCAACRKTEKRLHPDVFFVEPDKNVIKIEQVRDIQKKIIFKPMEGRKKIVIIDEAEKLNLHAANCLLKTLEEPPDDTVLILVASNGLTLLPTILSRCQSIRFAPLGTEVIRSFLERRGSSKDTSFIAALAQGSIKRALLLLETEFLARRREFIALLVAGGADSCEPLFHLAKMATEEPQNLPQVLEFLQTWYRDLYLLMGGFPAEKLYNRDMLAEMQEALQSETREQILKRLKKLQWIHARRNININYTMALESMLLQPMC